MSLTTPRTTRPTGPVEQSPPGRVRHRAGSDTSRWLVPVLVVGLALLATVCAVTVLGVLATRFG
jgi:hypothetical protein